MKKQLLCMLAAALGSVSSLWAADYNVGDYVTTLNGRYKVIGENLIKNGFKDFKNPSNGQALNNDSIAFHENGGPGDSPYMEVMRTTFLSSEAGGLSQSAAFYYSTLLEGGRTYVVTYKVKGYSDASQSTTTPNGGRNKNYQNVYINNNGDLDRTTEGGYNGLSNWVTYPKDVWTEIAYNYTASDNGFANLLFYYLLGGDCFADFGIYEATPILDDRDAKDILDRLAFYEENKADFPNGQDVLQEIKDEWLGYREDPANADVSLSDAIADIEAEVLDPNTSDASPYFSNFTFDDVSTGSKKVASGWTSSIGTDRWGISAAKFNYTTNYVHQDIGNNYDLSAGDYYQTQWLPKGKYLYAVKLQGYTYEKDGSGKNSNYYIPDYYNQVDGFKFFVNNDTIAVDSVPTYRGRLFQHVFEVAEDGEVTLGFSSPGTTGKVGGRLMFDNVYLRRIGTENIADLVFAKKVADSKNALKVMIDSAKTVVADNQYIFGRTILQDSINISDAYYVQEFENSQESVDGLTQQMRYMRQAIRDYYTINKEYTTLAADIKTANANYADETRPKGKGEFKAAITTAETYYGSLTVDSERDSVKLVAEDAALLAAQQTWFYANASVKTPATVNLVNADFSNDGTGWGTDSGSGNAAWKYGSAALFEGGYNAYYNRGYTATDAKHIYQDVTITENGVYEFAAQCMVNNSSWDMSSDDWSGFNTDTYLYCNTDSVYVITKGLGDKSQTRPEEVKWFNSVAKIKDVNALATPGVLRVGLENRTGADEAGTGANRPNLIYIGSCRLLYYGTIEDYEAGVVSVQDVTNSLNGDVYTLSGVKVRSNANSLKGLAKGIYIMNGKKYVVK